MIGEQSVFACITCYELKAETFECRYDVTDRVYWCDTGESTINHHSGICGFCGHQDRLQELFRLVGETVSNPHIGEMEIIN